MRTLTTKALAAMIGAGFMLGAAPAFAGEWRLDKSRCYDVREDRRDARGYHRDGRDDRYDRRQSQRHRAITVCPRSAFFYVPDRHERRRGDWRAPRLTFDYDREQRLYFRRHNGVRIYIRG